MPAFCHFWIAASVAWEAGKPLLIKEVEVTPPHKMEVRVKILFNTSASPMFTFGKPRSCHCLEKKLVNLTLECNTCSNVEFSGFDIGWGLHLRITTMNEDNCDPPLTSYRGINRIHALPKWNLHLAILLLIYRRLKSPAHLAQDVMNTTVVDGEWTCNYYELVTPEHSASHIGCSFNYAGRLRTLCFHESSGIRLEVVKLAFVTCSVRRWFWGTIFVFAVTAKLAISIWFEVIVTCLLVSSFDCVRDHNFAQSLLVLLLGHLLAETLADKFGRTKTATAQSVQTLIIGRLLAGIGIGISSAIVPLYISEISPTEIRGTLGSIKKSFMVDNVWHCNYPLCSIGTRNGILVLAVLYIDGNVVETKGQSLEEIERILNPPI
ncbi:hypothetical protein RHSIM_RhsimUnG0108800 [Rhododendron simsii]|uniref:Major facilitator superfamily (MFS) profile domain-containing protein n=1 Tax=Rhododendron simsii TaxID=118357 RepID=A0A834L4W7_RHOSS|nr:hypothetical protein RHSIM_RhsimUnG0108800 [Rhododendron simsii]